MKSLTVLVDIQEVLEVFPRSEHHQTVLAIDYGTVVYSATQPNLQASGEHAPPSLVYQTLYLGMSPHVTNFTRPFLPFFCVL